MTVGTRIDTTKGVVTTNNTGLNEGFSPFRAVKTTAITAATTLGSSDAGVFTISGTSATVVTMPSASAVPGATYIFRSLSVYAHALTCSLEVVGTKGFTDGTFQGSKLALSAAVGTSVMVVSDGTKYLVLGNSGSVTLSGT